MNDTKKDNHTHKNIESIDCVYYFFVHVKKYIRLL